MANSIKPVKLGNVISDIKQELDVAKTLAARNHNDSADIKESQEYINELEQDLSRVSHADSVLTNALKQRNYSDAKLRLSQLLKRRDELAHRVDELDDKLENCDISMDTNVYDASQCADYARDKQRFAQERDAIKTELVNLQHLINQYDK